MQLGELGELSLPFDRGKEEPELYFRLGRRGSQSLEGGFSGIFSNLFDTASSAAPKIPLCPGQLLLQHWLSDALTTRLDLISSILELPFN